MVQKDFENILLKKQKFPQSPEIIKKYSSEYNSCRSAIKYIWTKLKVGTFNINIVQKFQTCSK